MLFDLEGSGTRPTRREPKAIYGSAGVSEPGMVVFQNPTCYKVQATVRLNQSRIGDNSSEFMLLASQQSVVLEPKEIFEIPFCFIQNQNASNTFIGTIDVEVRKDSGCLWDDNDEDSLCLHWKYPIIGFRANSGTKEKLSFTGNVGQSQESYLAVRPNTGNIETGSNNLIVTEDFVIQRLNNKSEFTVTEADLTDISYSFETGIEVKEDIRFNFIGLANIEENTALVFEVRFSPKFPLISTAKILVTGKETFAYEIPVVLEARDDNIDAIIDLNAESVNVEQTFKIQYGDIMDSVSETGLRFNTWIESASGCYEITEKRSRSMLVKFTPQVYGHVYRGHLIIEKTDKFGLLTKRRCALRGWAGPHSPKKDDSGRRKSVVNKSGDNAVGTGGKKNNFVKPSHVRKKRDFISENMMLLSTAASSNIKGMRLNYN